MKILNNAQATLHWRVAYGKPPPWRASGPVELAETRLKLLSLAGELVAGIAKLIDCLLRQVRRIWLTSLRPNL